MSFFETVYVTTRSIVDHARVNEPQSTIHRVVIYLFHEQWWGWRPLQYREHHPEQLVTLGCSENIGRYNTPNTM